MLTIERALMINPKLIQMDKSSEGLAAIMVEEIGEIIHQLKQSSYSILPVEQNISLALDLADHAYIINKGAIVYESSPAALRKKSAIKNKYLGVE
jgi:branched-chain amino acid transport system ATP-binding protein